jgi:hypothetical protein
MGSPYDTLIPDLRSECCESWVVNTALPKYRQRSGLSRWRGSDILYLGDEVSFCLYLLRLNLLDWSLFKAIQVADHCERQHGSGRHDETARFLILIGSGGRPELPTLGL